VKKNKLFLSISIFALVILFGTSATCNMCGMSLSSKTTTSTVVDTESAIASTEAAESKETVAETTDKEEAKDTTKEKVTDTTKSSSTDTTKSSSTDTTKSSSTDPQAVAPTITLQIYEGPTYSQADDVCYYRIEAIVTGSPSPTVTFSKDDSNGSLGSKKVQVNLTKSNQNYTLTAKAKNSAGESLASIDLKWGCPLPLPVEISIVFHPSVIGSITPSSTQSFNQVSIGDCTPGTIPEDMRGRFAFDLNTLAGKKIVYAELKLVNPYIANPSGIPKGDIVINYNDFLPDISFSDYKIAAYALAGKFANDADPLIVSNDFLKTKIAERALAGIALQFGIGYWDMNNNNINSSGRTYQADDITLSVTYSE
jgi:hypothetical protein